jgi:hypothetical protein
MSNTQQGRKKRRHKGMRFVQPATEASSMGERDGSIKSVHVEGGESESLDFQAYVGKLWDSENVRDLYTALYGNAYVQAAEPRLLTVLLPAERGDGVLLGRHFLVDPDNPMVIALYGNAGTKPWKVPEFGERLREVLEYLPVFMMDRGQFTGMVPPAKEIPEEA